MGSNHTLGRYGPAAVPGHRALAAYGLPAAAALTAYRTACPDASPGDLRQATTQTTEQLPAQRSTASSRSTE